MLSNILSKLQVARFKKMSFYEFKDVGNVMELFWMKSIMKVQTINVIMLNKHYLE